MALNLYATPDEDGGFASLSPVRFTFDGRTGGAIDKKIYLRNSNPKRWYSNISIEAVDTSDERLSMVTEGVPGFFWKLAQGDRPLYPEEWDQVGKGNTITIVDDLGSDDFGDITTYLPIWVRVEIPQDVPIMTIKEIVLRVVAKERYVSG